MYNCYAHGWSSRIEMCPSCYTTTYTSTSGSNTTDYLVKTNPVKEFCPLCERHYDDEPSQECATEKPTNLKSEVQLANDYLVKNDGPYYDKDLVDAFLAGYDAAMERAQCLVEALERYRHVHHMTSTHSYGILSCPDDCTFGACEAIKKFRGTP